MTIDEMTEAEQAWAELRGKIRMAQLAKELGVTRGFVAQWVRVPEKYLARTAAFTQIARHDLRPDLYPPPDPWSSI
jgi:hypothetical protein